MLRKTDILRIILRKTTFSSGTVNGLAEQRNPDKSGYSVRTLESFKILSMCSEIIYGFVKVTKNALCVTSVIFINRGIKNKNPAQI